MPARRGDDLPDDADRLERRPEDRLQPAAADPLAVVDGDQRERSADRDADRPRERDRALRVRVVREQEDRADQGAGRENGVLERAEPEHPYARLVAWDAEILERLDVHREPTAGDEHAEAGGDDRTRPQRAQLDAAPDVGDLAVRERVADLRGHGPRDCERDPVPVGMPEVRGDRHVPRGSRDEDRRDERERGREDHEHHHVVRLVLPVVGEQHLEGAAPPQAKGGLRGHCLLRSQYTQEECASVVGVASGAAAGDATGRRPLPPPRVEEPRPPPRATVPPAGCRPVDPSEPIAMRPGGFEPPTRGLEVRRSVH